MYLVSVIEDQSVIEASLGGRVDAVEMKTFAEELEELFEDQNGPFYLLLDYSKAGNFDASTTRALGDLKDKAFENGALKVYSVPQEISDIEEHVATNIQNVLEGREEFLMYAHQARFAPLPTQYIAKAA